MAKTAYRFYTVGTGLVRILTLLTAIATARPCLAEDTGGYQGMAISVVKIEKHCFDNLVQVSGALLPKREVQVRPEREGLVIAQVLVEPGDTVVTGQVLVRLNPPPGAPGGSVAVKSPAAGVAISVSAVIGTFASASAPDPMFRIVVDGELELKGEFLATSLARVRVDQDATVNILGIGPVPGKVTSISTEIDPMTQLGNVRISVGIDPRLRAGAYARAEINTGKSCGVAIPLSAVLYGTEGAVVQVIRGDRVETRRVEVGLLAKGMAEIRDGVSEADVVVARAGAFLREGDRVRPVMMDAAPAP